MFTYTGTYYEHTSDNIMRSAYYTFTPKPLMEGGFYSMDEELTSLLISAHRSLGVLEGMIAEINDTRILKELILLKESYYSWQIDYNDYDLYTFFENCAIGSDASITQRIMSAYEISPKSKIDISAISDMYGIVVNGLDSKEKAYVRNGQIFLSDAISNMKNYNPTAPAHINSALNDIIKYLNDTVADPIIRAALTHYQFEMVHPFDRYNGIVGRILISKTLQNAGLDSIRYLNLSECLYYNRNNYFDKLRSTQLSGGYILWIKFFIQMIYKAANASITQIKRYQKIVKIDEEKIKNSKASASTMAVYMHFKRCLISDIKQVAGSLSLAYNTIDRAIQSLQKLGILSKSSIGSRNRRFVHSELIALFLNTNDNRS